MYRKYEAGSLRAVKKKFVDLSKGFASELQVKELKGIVVFSCAVLYHFLRRSVLFKPDSIVYFLRGQISEAY
jgi:hypothetical protein